MRTSIVALAVFGGSRQRKRASPLRRRESGTPSGIVEINISDPLLGKSWGVNPDRRIAIERPGTAGLTTPRTIEGLRVDGIRRTTTIPAGAIGNERAIVVTSDQWTSPDLKVLVLSESSDPRTGTSSYKLVNVKRGDPPASLFQVPADFTLQAMPSLNGRGARGRQ